jgi:transcriptional regulator with XRE-family HTH domain
LLHMPHPVSLRPNGARIRELRRRAGKKPGPFAEKVEISYSHLANIENGHHTGASAEVLNRMARELGVPLEELIDVTGFEPRNDARPA